MLATEKRTQIYLTGRQHAALRRVATKRRVSLAQIVREAIDAFLHSPSKPGRAAPGPDPLADLVGFIEGPGDLSERHDEYLYGRARRRKRRA